MILMCFPFLVGRRSFGQGGFILTTTSMIYVYGWPFESGWEGATGVRGHAQAGPHKANQPNDLILLIHLKSSPS